MHRRHSSTCRSGMVLIAVLLILSVITAIVLEFHYDARIRFQMADNTRTAYQALHCAEAGLTIAAAALEQKSNIWTEDELVETLSGSVRVPVGKGHCTIVVSGESGRINVNDLIDGNGRPVRSRVDQMLRLIDLLNGQSLDGNRLSYSLVPAIIDWIDVDDEVTVLPFVQGQNAGAESKYYRSLEKPYECRNGPLDVLGELILVKGVTREVLYGRMQDGQSVPAAGLESLLTVHGSGRPSLNQASVLMLQSLSEQIDRPLAERIVEHRPYSTLDELARVPGMTPDILKVIRERTTVHATDEHYTVTVCGTVGRSVRTVRVVFQRGGARRRVTPLVRWEL